MKRGLGKGGFAQSLLITWLLTLFLVGRVPGTSKADNNDVFSPEKIIGVMRKVNTWQLGHPWK